MNYYCLFFRFQQLPLLLHSCKCLQSHSQLPGSHNNYNNRNNQSSINRYCELIMTYTEVVELLLRSPCQSFEDPNQTDKNNRINRDVATASIDVNALQATINDHRIMIEYLVNNTINATYVTQAINNHQTRGPIVSS